MYLLLLSLLSLISQTLSGDTLTMRMPGLTIPHDDIYMHKSSERFDKEVYVTSFQALANFSVVHHMLIYGCQEVQNKTVWQGGSPCTKGGTILWAWALDAPKFDMPANVSAVIGTDEIRYIVMELHYKVEQPEEYYDKSGVRLYYTSTPTKYNSGIYLMMADSDVTLPANTAHVQLDVGCNYTSPNINVFAYRTHGHSYARKVSGYRVRNDSWIEIGSRDPREPELFVRMPLIVSIEKGDKVYARCEYDTTASDDIVMIGSTHHDEMCNFYMMYYTESISVGNIAEMCTKNMPFTIPENWYSKYFPHTTLFYIFIILCCALVLGPLLYGLHSCLCVPNHQRPGDGFEKLFGGEEEDEEEDEILYKSYKGGFP